MKKLKLNSQPTSHSFKKFGFSNYWEIIGGALPGATGGAFLGSSFGFLGSLLVSFLGALVTGYSSYKDVKKENCSV